MVILIIIINNNDNSKRSFINDKEGISLKDKILKLIKQYETIIIHRHVRPDPDAYGSQGGLAEIIKTSYPDKNVYTVGEEEPSLNYLRRLDVIDDETFNQALVIICDTANTERICDERYKLGETIIKIDHHPNDDEYGDIMWVDTTASSTSEMIYELYLYGKDKGLKFSDEAARLIYAGIVGDTGRFLFPSTSTKTFAYASELVNYNFSRPELYNAMYELELNVMQLSGYLLQNFTVQPNGVAYVSLTKEKLNKYDVDPTEASSLISSIGNVSGVKVWALFVEEDDLIRVRLRSKGPVINEVAKKYNGGGHPLAAGASIYKWEDVQAVIADLDEVCRN